MELDKARDGSRLGLSQALTLVENGLPFSTEEEGRVIGITGAPGVGKSCLVDKLAQAYARNGEKVAILAIDPSSPISGGALLGDRLRMESADLEDLVYMRSVATRGETGAVPSVVADMVAVLKECGWKRVIIETVGSGQAEFRIAAVADTIVLVEAPGMGDAIQSEKAGIIELVDIIVVNKSDLAGADATAANIISALSAGSKNIPVKQVSSHTGDGITYLVQAIDEVADSGISRTKWQERLASQWMRKMSHHTNLDSILDELESSQISIQEAILLLEA
ncbi:MAG: ArgK/MeaB family GTPase [Candidatus Poseidoniales archaeon]|jgi:LAO/AO transport system kinase